MTEPDLSQPVQPGGDPRGTGESLDAPAADVPPVDEQSGAPTAAQPVNEVTIIEIVDEDPTPQEVQLRRAPRYRSFIGTGAAVGAVLGVVLTMVFPDDGELSTGSVLAYLALGLALVGAVIGGAVAVLVERRAGD